jgi:hypothetical protein
MADVSFLTIYNYTQWCEILPVEAIYPFRLSALMRRILKSNLSGKSFQCTLNFVPSLNLMPVIVKVSNIQYVFHNKMVEL